MNWHDGTQNTVQARVREFESLRQKSKEGSATADEWCQLGRHYRMGSGSPSSHPDYKEAFRCFSAGAEKNREAAFFVALCYQKGEGTRLDVDQAKHWFMHANKLGHPEAGKTLLAIYEYDPGFRQCMMAMCQVMESSKSDGTKPLHVTTILDNGAQVMTIVKPAKPKKVRSDPSSAAPDTTVTLI